MSFVETLDGLALKKSALVHRFEHLIASKSDQELEAMARKSRALTLRKCILPDRSATLIFDWIAQSTVTAQDFAGLESVCSLGYLPGSKKRSPSRRIWNICSNTVGRRRSV